MWNLPGPGIEPVSPALAGGFSTTGPPGSLKLVFDSAVESGSREGKFRLPLNSAALTALKLHGTAAVYGPLCAGSQSKPGSAVFFVLMSSCEARFSLTSLWEPRLKLSFELASPSQR